MPPPRVPIHHRPLKGHLLLQTMAASVFMHGPIGLQEDFSGEPAWGDVVGS